MSVKVGVRVRPFNKREQQLGCKCCVDMDGKTTHLINPDNKNDSRPFVFDYSFWSHDRFSIDSDGIARPVDSKYADQQKVYSEIGEDILTNAWQGYNCCLFAYGQTGSGKSYSMLGYGPNRGVIPMVCDNIFTRIGNDTNKAHTYQVKVSMLQIYNETLRDLLSKSKNQQIKICESKKLGVYVEGLVKHAVHSYEQIDKKIEQGSNNRSIAATLMNQSSSRSHTIVSITFVKKIQISPTQTSVKYSTIHLVDLAGSESVGKTGVSSTDRLRQAAKINQSLTTLGRVIQILAENASKTQKTFVPYRDSKLTFILRNALGGNSRTAMICAISPADDNYQQTLSTLRYANRAKKIQNKAIVNESDVDKLIRTLKQENEKLKKMLEESHSNKSINSESISNKQIISNIKETNKNIAALGVVPDDYSLFDDSDNLSSFSKDDRDLSILDYNEKIDEKEPYITNLSQDQLLSGRLKYSCSKILRIGTKLGNPKPDVVLAALGILPQHCQIRNDDGKIFIEVLDEQASDYTFVNGNSVHKDQAIQLMNFDRLIFGTGCIFIVRIPDGDIRSIVKQKEQKVVNPEDIDYTFAITQIQQHQISGGMSMDKNQKVSQQQQQQIRKKVLEQIQVSYNKIKQEKQEQLKKRLQEQEKQYQQKIAQIQKIRSQQAKKLKQELQKQQSQALKLRTDKQKIQQQIVHFKQLEKKLQQSNVDKQSLSQARKALDQKIKTINELQNSLLTIESKQKEMIQQMEKKEVVLQKQLQFKMIMCNNENILNEYRVELSKKAKNTNEVKDLLVKKQRIEMHKQLIELIPMIQKFNLIAKEMNKNVQCGLSIDYTYISQVQALQMLKNSSYKNKIKISIHVHNKGQRRSYFWNVDIFKNRYEIAMSMFEIYIRNQLDPKLQTKENDPYWDPASLQLIGVTFLSLEFLFYKLDFEGDISIVRKGSKIGTLHVKLFPTDNKRSKNFAKQTLDGIVIHNPTDLIEKNLFFCIEFSHLKLQKSQMYQKVQLQYSLLQNSYKNMVVLSGPMSPDQFKFSYFHIIPDLSETIIYQYINQPLAIRFLGEHKQLQDDDDNLTVRDDVSEHSPDRNSAKSSFTQSFSEKKVNVSKSFAVRPSTPSQQTSFSYIQVQAPKKNPTTTSPLKKSFANHGHQSGIIVSNFDVMQKIELEFNKKKEQQKRKEKQKQLKKDDKKGKGKNGKDDCSIF